MSGYDDGFNRLMRPGDNNWNAFNAGAAARGHQEAMANMTAQHQAATESFFASAYSNPSASPSLGHGGGGYAGPSAPLSGKAKIALISLLLALVIFFTLIIVEDATRDERRAAYGEARHAARMDAEKQAQTQWQPALTTALEDFNPASDFRAIEDAATLSPCIGDSIRTLLDARTLGFTHCHGVLRGRGRIGASVDHDRFLVEYETTDPTIRHRLGVMAVTQWALRARPAQGRDAPVVTAIEQLGAATVERYVGQGCAAIVAARIATNLPPGVTSESDMGGDFVAAYFSQRTVSIACPAGKQLRVAVSRRFQRSWDS